MTRANKLRRFSRNLLRTIPQALTSGTFSWGKSTRVFRLSSHSSPVLLRHSKLWRTLSSVLLPKPKLDGTSHKHTLVSLRFAWLTWSTSHKPRQNAHRPYKRVWKPTLHAWTSTCKWQTTSYLRITLRSPNHNWTLSFTV